MKLPATTFWLVPRSAILTPLQMFPEMMLRSKVSPTLVPMRLSEASPWMKTPLPPRVAVGERCSGGCVRADVVAGHDVFDRPLVLNVDAIFKVA